MTNPKPPWTRKITLLRVEVMKESEVKFAAPQSGRSVGRKPGFRKLSGFELDSSWNTCKRPYFWQSRRILQDVQRKRSSSVEVKLRTLTEASGVPFCCLPDSALPGLLRSPRKSSWDGLVESFEDRCCSSMASQITLDDVHCAQLMREQRNDFDANAESDRRPSARPVTRAVRSVLE
jgi:hypothetical protein